MNWVIECSIWFIPAITIVLQQDYVLLSSGLRQLTSKKTHKRVSYVSFDRKRERGCVSFKSAINNFRIQSLSSNGIEAGRCHDNECWNPWCLNQFLFLSSALQS